MGAACPRVGRSCIDRFGRLHGLSCLPKQWIRMGTANNNPISVRALSFIMVGHVRHHINVLHTSYKLSAGA